MKRYITIAAALTLTCASFAQSVDDAINFSWNDYYGTARSVALGNAMTAVGGDLGSVNINPAGSAVSNYSQFTISPGFSVSTFSSAYSDNGGTTYGGIQADRHFWGNLPNIGMNFSMDMHNDYGLKRISFGIIANTTARYSGNNTLSGRTTETSMMGSFAAAATGFSEDDLNSYNSNAPWPAVAAFRSGMIYYDNVANAYLGASETTALKDDGTYDIFTAGDVSHTLSRQTRGAKSDFIMNVGFNINDELYMGFNLGIPSINYSVDNYLTEYAVNTADFPQNFDTGQTYWDKSTYNYVYNASIAGIYAKAGIIWRPVQFLRLGAAIQSPTAFSIEETYTVAATSSYIDTRYNGKDNSPEGSYEYSLRAPYRANLGAALTLGGLAMLTADWEVSDYSTMRYKQGADYDFIDENILRTNEVIKRFAGTAHNLRLGLELNIGALALRGGYSVATSPSRWYYDNEGYIVDSSEYLTYYDDFARGIIWLEDKYKVDTKVTTASFGFGYKSSGAFFADFAMRLTNYPTAYLGLYDGYIAGTPSPSYKYDRSYREALVTVGWRF